MLGVGVELLVGHRTKRDRRPRTAVRAAQFSPWSRVKPSSPSSSWSFSMCIQV